MQRIQKSFWMGTILGALLVSAVMAAQNAGEFQIERRMNGKAIIDLKDNDRALYAIGFMDGLRARPNAEAEKWVPPNCTTPMTGIQMSEQIAKYIRDLPARRDSASGILTWNALVEACKKKSN